MTADIKHLSKLTNIFVMYDWENFDDMEARDVTINYFESFGYTNIFPRKYLTLEEIQREEVPFVNVDSDVLSVLEIRQWYTFIGILMRIRAFSQLDPVLVSFPGPALNRDIVKIPEYERIPAAVVIISPGLYLLNAKRASAMLRRIYSRSEQFQELGKIQDSVKDYLENSSVKLVDILNS